ERLVVGRKAEAVWVRQLLLGDDDLQLAARIPAIDIGGQFALFAAERAGIGRAEARIEFSVGVGRAAGLVRMAFVHAIATRRIGEFPSLTLLNAGSTTITSGSG